MSEAAEHAGTVVWQLSADWMLAPAKIATRSAWAGAVAAGGTRLQESIERVQPYLDESGLVTPFVVVSDSAAIRTTGWIGAWQTRDTTEASIVTRFRARTAERDGLHSFEQFDVRSTDDSRFLALHLFETADDCDEALVERVAAFLVHAPSAATYHLSVVTRDLRAFENLPALAAEVLERTVSATREAVA